MTWEELELLSGRDVHVVGLASTEGAAVAAFLWSNGIRRLTLHDFLPAERLREAFYRTHVALPRDERERRWDEIASLPVRHRLGDEYLYDIEHAEAVFVGQAWRLYEANLPVLARLHADGVEFHTMSELYFDLAPAPILAVTGSNGKSTTSRVAESILSATGRRTYFAGNERRGIQVLRHLREMTEADVLVLEVSNRQLVDLHPRPHIAVITTILPNHLDEHGCSFEEYAAVKRRLVEYQRPTDYAVLNADDETCREIGASLPGQVHWFSTWTKLPQGAWIENDRIHLRRDADGPAVEAGPAESPGLRGEHNRSNVLAASLATWLAGATPEAIATAVAGFTGLRHRIQFVWRSNGVDYYDDLNATSPHATLAALRTLGSSTLLIAGGDDKGLDFGVLSTEIVKRVKRLILLPGDGSNRLLAALHDVATAEGPTVVQVETLEQAVVEAVDHARAGDTVVLSPACPGVFSRHYSGGEKGATGFRGLLREHAAPS